MIASTSQSKFSQLLTNQKKLSNQPAFGAKVSFTPAAKQIVGEFCHNINKFAFFSRHNLIESKKVFLKDGLKAMMAYNMDKLEFMGYLLFPKKAEKLMKNFAKTIEKATKKVKGDIIIDKSMKKPFRGFAPDLEMIFKDTSGNVFSKNKKNEPFSLEPLMLYVIQKFGRKEKKFTEKQIITEFAELITDNGKKIDNPFTKIAQEVKSRSG